MKSATLFAIAAVAAMPSPASARDIVTIDSHRNGTRILLDRDSIRPVEDGRKRMREAIVSVDNSRNPVAAAQFAASDNKVRVDCPAGEIAVLWSRGYAEDGAEIAGAPTAPPHGLKPPRNRFETVMRDAVCAAR